MNKISITEKIVIAFFSIIFVSGIFFGFRNPNQQSFGGASDGVFAQVATSSTITVGPQSTVTVFADNVACTGRIISTLAQPIMLSFSSSVVPSVSVGHVQAASSTIAYDSGIYGCGPYTAYAAASTTITKTETR